MAPSTTTSRWPLERDQDHRALLAHRRDLRGDRLHALLPRLPEPRPDPVSRPWRAPARVRAGGGAARSASPAGAPTGTPACVRRSATRWTTTITSPSRTPSRCSPSAAWATPAAPPSTGAVRLLHLVAGVSYFKAAAPPRIEIEGDAARAATARFLGRLYTQGLGEFAWTQRAAGDRSRASSSRPGRTPPRRAGAGRPDAALAGAGGRRQGLGGEPGRADRRRRGAWSPSRWGASRRPTRPPRIEGVPMVHVERHDRPRRCSPSTPPAPTTATSRSRRSSRASRWWRRCSRLRRGGDVQRALGERRATSTGRSSARDDQPPVLQELGGRARPGRGGAPRGGARPAPASRCCARARSWRSAAPSPGCRPTTRTFMSCNTGFRIHEPAVAGLVRRLPEVPLRLPRAGALPRPRADLAAIFGRDMLDDPAQDDGLPRDPGHRRREAVRVRGRDRRGPRRAARRGGVAGVGGRRRGRRARAARSAGADAGAVAAVADARAASTRIPERHRPGHRCVSRSLRAGGSASGASGARAAASPRAVAARLPGTPLLLVDESRAPGAAGAWEGLPVVADPAALAACDVVVRSPGVSIHRPEVAALRRRGWR